MKWVPVLTRRTMYICFISLFLFYLFYALNISLVDENQITLKYIFLRKHITRYKKVTIHLASLFGLNLNESNRYMRLKPNTVPVKRLPDALIIGVKKCGTRALLEFLRGHASSTNQHLASVLDHGFNSLLAREGPEFQWDNLLGCLCNAHIDIFRLHPDVRAARSEVHFFDKFYHKGFEWYRDKMPATLEGQITMEKTPSYWVTRSAPRRVRDMNPSVKLLAVVRDPVTRAISDYTQSASKRATLPRFEDLALINSSVRWEASLSVVDASWPPVRLGVYARPFKRWLKKFPRSKLMLVSGERLVVDPAAEMTRVQDFLGLKRVITDKHFYFNSTKGFPCLLKSEISSTPHCLGKTKGRSHPFIDPQTIQRLRDFYRPFNEMFYQLSGINFGWP